MDFSSLYFTETESDVFERLVKKPTIFFSHIRPMYFLNFQRCRHSFWVNLQLLP